MKKPDRFERMVKNITYSDGFKSFCSPQDVINLLRREHRAVVRMVEKELYLWSNSLIKLPTNAMNEQGRICRVAQCHDILTKLQKRAK